MSDLSALAASGMNIDGLAPAEKEALERLDPSEVAALASIREKLNEEPDVAGHLASVTRAADGVVIW